MKPSDVCFYVVPRCRFLLICTLVSTTVNPFSDTILETLKRVQARNVFQSCSASLSPNPRDEQQTPSAEIPVVQDHMALISVENMTPVSPIILAIFTLSQTHTHTHTHTHTLCAVTNTVTQPPQCSAGGIWPDLGKHEF